MNKAQEDRVRAKYADKMRERSAKAKADLAAKRVGKSSAQTPVADGKPKS
jgi:hypothetical protein